MNDPVKITELACTPEQAAAIIAENWNRVCDDVARASVAAGRSADEVRIVGVTKYVDAATTSLLVDAGCRHLGENRPQMLTQKPQWFAEHRGDMADAIRWHQIGHLQRNKVRRLLLCNPLIHSVDSERLLDEIDAESKQQSRVIDVLMEINVSGESAKTGLPPDQLVGIVERHGTPDPADQSASFGVRILGLMAMAGWGTDADQARSQFARLRAMRDDLQQRTGTDLPELSMGMSGDYEAAIAEGATIVRIGSSLFEGVLA